MEIYYSHALNIRNEFIYLIGESFSMNNEQFIIKEILIVPVDEKKQNEFFKDKNILPFIKEKCDVAVILSNKNFKDHFPYITLESLLKVRKIDFHPEDYLHLRYAI